jgi:hypothetical protein
MTLPPSANYLRRKVVPFLPGTTFKNPKQEIFTVPQTLGFKDGIPTEKFDYPGIGGEFEHSIDRHFSDEDVDVPRDFSSLWTHKNKEFAVYGGQPANRTVTSVQSAREKTVEKKIGYPPHIAYDKVIVS